MTLDYSHPLHAASLYVEELKYGPGPRVVEGVTKALIVGQREALLREAGVNADARLLVEDTNHYATSFERSLGVRAILARSIFMDGLMHGVALAAGLRAEEPRS